MWRTASYPASQTRCRIYYRAYCVAQVTIIAPAKYHDCQRTRTAVADASCLTVNNMTSMWAGFVYKTWIPIVPPTLQRDWSSATGRSVRPVGRSVHTLRQSDRKSDEIKHPTVCPTVCPTVGRSVYTIRSSDRPVGQTSLTDRSVRRSERVNAQLVASVSNEHCAASEQVRAALSVINLVTGVQRRWLIWTISNGSYAARCCQLLNLLEKPRQQPRTQRLATNCLVLSPNQSK